MKTILKLAAGVILLVMIGGAVTLQSAIKDARSEQQSLQQSGADAGATQQKNDAAQPTAESVEAAKLREANKELPKLRNEVRQLRRQAEALAKLQAENEKLKNAPVPGARQYPPDYIRRAALVDAGLATPEATMQTFLWAMTRGNLERMKSCLASNRLADLPQMSAEQFQKQAEEAAKVMPGFRIVERTDMSPYVVRLKVEMMPGMEDAEREGVLERVGNEWKIAGGF